VPARDSALHDVPCCNAVAMVDLLESDARVAERLLHRGRVRHGSVRVGIERLDEHAYAAVGDARPDECVRVLET